MDGKVFIFVGYSICGIACYFLITVFQDIVLPARRVLPNITPQAPCTTLSNCSLPDWHDDIWSSLRWKNATVNRVLYNRIPKTGSTVVLSVVRELSKRNRFRSVSSPINIFFNISYFGQERFVQSMMGQKPPLFYNRHLNFIDFTKFNMPQPFYINTVREPVRHFLSFYYFMRGMSAWRYRYTKEDRNMTLDSCVQQNLKCEPHRQIRFFCGQDAICNSPQLTQGALQLAKRNIQRHYAVVGINEDLRGFFFVLEYLLPRFFHGASPIYEKKKNSYRWFTTKKLKKPLSESTQAKLKKILHLDYDLYYFVKQRFYKLKCIAEKCNANRLRTNPSPRGRYGRRKDGRGKTKNTTICTKSDSKKHKTSKVC